jgi:hypothetical protein
MSNIKAQMPILRKQSATKAEFEAQSPKFKKFLTFGHLIFICNLDFVIGI